MQIITNAFQAISVQGRKINSTTLRTMVSKAGMPRIISPPTGQILQPAKKPKLVLPRKREPAEITDCDRTSLVSHISDRRLFFFAALIFSPVAVQVNITKRTICSRRICPRDFLSLSQQWYQNLLRNRCLV